MALPARASLPAVLPKVALSAVASSERIFTLLDTAPSIREPEKSEQLEGSADIVFDEDADLLDRLATGDEAAFRMLVERHIDRAYAIALRIVGNAADAEDVVQDAVVRALARVAQFEHRTVDGMQAYLREAVRNRIRDEVRRVTRRVSSMWCCSIEIRRQGQRFDR